MMEASTAAPPAAPEDVVDPETPPVSPPNGASPPDAGGDDLEGEGADEQGQSLELAIEGDGQLSLKVGGAKPDTAELKLRSGSVELPRGEYPKGSTVNLLIKVQIAEVHFVDKRDGSTGEITSTTRRHVGKITGVEKV